ncbi:hypothetical protein PP939_gp120 [Rhizobium phage RL38J1]|uniref:Lipoprotein n=1 Tax=Rhizobium phage RL38J1 TaxID=2663232 RepID=A0A6B9J374_9CAUD|nr:hypothetical protein PP939_gp120 [Rhizobium phage RL38J1]QGZ14042.1 hypothetical protein RL38J1_120 [Rhizobium phage RL38J1]
MKYVFLALLALLASCAPSDNVPRGGDQLGYSVLYFLDKRTKLCFARNNSRSANSQVLTIVPCTDEVKKAIEEDKNW